MTMARYQHAIWCTEPDDYCRGECLPEPDQLSGFALDYYDPDDVEPMGGDPWWREREP